MNNNYIFLYFYNFSLGKINEISSNPTKQIRSLSDLLNGKFDNFFY